MSNEPTMFRPLSWHKDSWGQLQGSIRQGRAPHALLLEGAPGTGRHQFAQALAARLLCEQPTPEGACGACRSCELLSAGTHADYRRLEPAEEGKSIGIDAIREALRFLAATASLGERKVLTVAPAEKMTTAAFNAFLKGLEEPPPGTAILLVTTRGFPIPATIKSRCQRLTLVDPPKTDAMEWIRSQTASRESTLSEDDIETMMSLMPGRPLLTLDLLGSGAAEGLLGLSAILAQSAQRSPEDRSRLRAWLTLQAGKVEIMPFLDLVEGFFTEFLRKCSAEQLRSETGSTAFTGLADIAHQRAAVQAGSNPNPDLLRHRTIESLLGVIAA